jgi:hypothetical protein
LKKLSLEDRCKEEDAVVSDGGAGYSPHVAGRSGPIELATQPALPNPFANLDDTWFLGAEFESLYRRRRVLTPDTRHSIELIGRRMITNRIP